MFQNESDAMYWTNKTKEINISNFYPIYLLT